jgi:hypothetical protein
VYPVLEQHVVPSTYTLHFVGNQFPIMLQPLNCRDRQHVQHVIILVPTTIQVNTSLPTYISRGSTHQPLNGGQPRDSLRGSSPRGDPLGGSPFNLPIGSYGWLALDLRMFIPPCYQPHVMKPIRKPTTKLPYMKLQYPTYVKDTNPNAHIKMLKNAIKANGETMEVDIINLFGFTLKDNIFEWGENYVQDHPNCIFEELERTFCKQFKIIKNDDKVYV